MSDIREAFEIVDRELRRDIPAGGSGVIRAWGQIKTALQSQTAPAVPDVTAAEELASALREIEGTVNRTATSDQFIRHLKQIATDALAAAPKPDHIGGVLQQTAPAVPEGWRTAKDGGHWPHIGGKYLIKLNGVLQHEIYEFDQADDGCGGGEYFWDRDDLDEAAPFDPENDAWIPIDQAGVTTSAVPEAVHDLICGIRSINRANHHLVTVHGDDEPCYYQRAEWIQWILELADKAEAAAPQPEPLRFSDTAEEIEERLACLDENACPHCGGSGHKDDVAQPDHSPDAGKVVGDLTETAIKSSPTYRALYAEKQHLLSLLKQPAADGGEVEPVADSEAIKAMSLMRSAIHCGTEWDNSLDDAYETIKRRITHPAQPRNEVQAEALEAFEEKLLRAANPLSKYAAVQLCQSEAARLRSNGGDA